MKKHNDLTLSNKLKMSRAELKKRSDILLALSSALDIRLEIYRNNKYEDVCVYRSYDRDTLDIQTDFYIYRPTCIEAKLHYVTLFVTKVMKLAYNKVIAFPTKDSMFEMIRTDIISYSAIEKLGHKSLIIKTIEKEKTPYTRAELLRQFNLYLELANV